MKHLFSCVGRACFAFYLASCLVRSAQAAEPTGPITGDYEVTVEAGATETWSGVVSGSGRIVKKGNGTLALTAANTFTGGIQIDAGIVRADNAGALSSGPITLSPAAATAANICQLRINRSGTYANDITQTADSYVDPTAGEDSASILVVYDVTKAVFTGKITSLGNMHIRPQKVPSENDGSGPGTTFNGDIDAAGKRILVASYGAPTFNGKITCKEFYHIDAWSGRQQIKLGNSANEIGLLRIRNNVYRAMANGAYGGARVLVTEAWNEVDHGCLFLGGTVQRVQSLDDTSPQSIAADSSSSYRSIDASNASKLILTGEATSRTTKMSVCGLVSLLLDAQDYPGFVQTFSTRTSTTTGDIVVSNGTLKVKDTASFRKVPRIVVGPNGTLSVESTAATALAGVRELAVDGTCTITAADALPNDASLSLALGASARLTLPADLTLTVASLTVNGQSKQGGTYGEEVGVYGGKVKVPSGAYNVNVPAGETRVIDEKITGDLYVQKTGAGAALFTNPENDFTGGVVIDGGSLQVCGTNTLGTGTITINSIGSADCRLQFVGNAMLTNDIVHTGTANDNYPAIFINDVDGVLLTGDIVSSGDFHIRHDRRGTATLHPAPGPTSVFEGDVTVARKLSVRSYGEMHFKGTLVCDTFDGANAHSAGGKVFLYSDRNKAVVMRAYAPFIICQNDNVLTNRLVFQTDGWKSGGSRVDLNGHAQVVKSLGTESTVYATFMNETSDSTRFHCVYSDGGEAWLTVSGEVQSNSRETYASINEGASLRVDTQNNPGFNQIINGRTCWTTGEVAVVLGKLTLKGRTNFPKVSRIFVGANGVLDASAVTVAPFKGQIESIELEENARLVLPAGAAMTARTVTINGRDYTAGTFSADTVPQLSGGVITANGSEPTVSRWTGAEGEAFSTAGNWNPAVDLVYGSSRASFGDGSGTARADADALFAGIVFSRENGDFTVARDATPHGVGFVGSVSASASDTPHRYAMDVPMTAYGTVVADAAAKQSLVFKDAFADENALTGRMDIGGAGEVAFEGENVVAGAIRSTTSVWRVTGTLATPGHVDQGEPANGGAKSITIAHPSSETGTTTAKEYGLCLSNAVIEKPVFISNKIGRRSIWSLPGTTNEIRGKVRFDVNQGVPYGQWQPIRTDANAELTFSGGAFFTHSFRPCGDGTVRFTGKPISALQHAGLNVCQGRVIVETTGNSFTNVCIGYSSHIGKPTLEFAVSGAMTNGNLLVGVNGGSPLTPTADDLGNGPYTLDMHATTQRCSRVAVTSIGVVTGEYPAMIEVFDGRAAGQAAGFAVAGPVNGGVGFHMCGGAGNTLTFSGQKFTSCGDLKVSSGTMEFAAGAAWRNGRNVTVCGTGVLKVASNGAVGRSSHLTVADGGILEIPAGVTLTVRKATVGGNEVGPGVYATGSLGGVVTGGGSLRVRGDSSMMVVR